ncbi:hypothetical protein B0J17DRAFT_664302 [Rhizoctonia solani]|nr:hypothetical protein B0J17DRAFT_664302 [Rhizoctonia solani]
MTQSELYKITLRDTTFTLDRSQVEFDSPNYFTSCFLGSFTESQAREIRLSRDPALFSIIVNYLSGYTILPIQPPSGMSEQATLENLLRDALFYGLDELASMLEEHKSDVKALGEPEERTVKNYVMIVWPVSIWLISISDLCLLWDIHSKGWVVEKAILWFGLQRTKHTSSATPIPYRLVPSHCCSPRVPQWSINFSESKR